MSRSRARSSPLRHARRRRVTSPASSFGAGAATSGSVGPRGPTSKVLPAETRGTEGNRLTAVRGRGRKSGPGEGHPLEEKGEARIAAQGIETGIGGEDHGLGVVPGERFVQPGQGAVGLPQ